MTSNVLECSLRLGDLQTTLHPGVAHRLAVAPNKARGPEVFRPFTPAGHRERQRAAGPVKPK